MVLIYKLCDNNGKIYVGSTNRTLKVRFNEHKYQDRYDFDFKKTKIYLLEKCNNSERFERENFWIDKLSAINKARASTGPVGFKQSEKAKKLASKIMTNVHKNNPEAIARARAKSLTPERQKERQKKAIKARWDKMPTWFAKCKLTGKLFGPYKGNFVASKELGLHDTTIIRNLKLKRTNRKYEMFYENAEAALSL